MRRDDFGNLALRYAGPRSMDTSSMVMIERLSGPLTAGDLAQMTRNLVQRADPSVRVQLLVDLSEANLDSIGLKELLSYVRHTEQIGLHFFAVRVAIVASGDKNHTLARLYQSLVRHDDHTLAVFSNVESALAWIRSSEPDSVRATA